MAVYSQTQLRQSNRAEQIQRKASSQIKQNNVTTTPSTEEQLKIQEQQLQQQEEAQKEYEKKMAEYNAKFKEAQEWETAERLVFSGKEYAAKGDPGVWSKIKQIHAGQNAAQKLSIIKGEVPAPPTGKVTPPYLQKQEISKPEITTEVISPTITSEKQKQAVYVSSMIQPTRILSKQEGYKEIMKNAVVKSSTPKPSMTSNQLDPTKQYSRSFVESTKAFVQTAAEDIKKIGKAIVLGRDIGELKDPFKEFNVAGKMKGETIVNVPQFGTITQQVPTGIKKTTAFELQKETAINVGGISPQYSALSLNAQAEDIAQQEVRKVESKYSNKVTSGELSVEEANKLAKQELEVNYKNRIKRINNPDLTKRSGESLGNALRSVTISAALIGGSIASPTFAAGLGGASLAAAGQLSVRSGQEFSRGEYLKSAFTLGESALYAYTGTSLIESSIGTSGRIPKEITKLRIKELESRPLKIKGISIQANEDQSLALISGKRSSYFSSQKVDLLAPAYKTGEGIKEGVIKFSITGGKGISTTKVVDFGLQGIVPVKESILTTTGEFSFTARGLGGLAASSKNIVPNVVELNTPFKEGVTGSLGRLDIVKGNEVIKTSFGGVGETNKNLISILGGNPEKISVKTSGILFKPSSYGQISIVSPEEFKMAVTDTSFLKPFRETNYILSTTATSTKKTGTSLIKDITLSKLATTNGVKSKLIQGSASTISKISDITLPVVKAESSTVFPIVVAEKTQTTTTTPSIKLSTTIIQKETQTQTQEQKPIQTTFQVSSTTTTTKQKQRSAQLTFQPPRQEFLQKPKQETIQQPIQEQLPAQIVTQLPRQSLIPKLASALTTKTILTNINTPVIPIIPTTFGKTSEPKKSTLGKVKSKIEKIFEAFVFKKGKAVSLGKTETQYGAEKILKTKLESTLAASGFVTSGKKKLKTSELKLFEPEKFRKSKVSPFVVVEKKSKRLRKGTTGFEIQPFRWK